MRVDVEGDGDVGVPEPLADHFRMYVVLEELGGMGVALLVEADAPNLKA